MQAKILGVCLFGSFYAFVVWLYVQAYKEARSAKPKGHITLTFKQAYWSLRPYWGWLHAVCFALWFKEWPLACLYMTKLARQAKKGWRGSRWYQNSVVSKD
jgi:hypothetical protein